MHQHIATKPSISKSTAIRWAGGSQIELARRLDVTPSAVSQWAETLPDGRVWQLHALGCPSDVPAARGRKSRRGATVAG